MPFDALTTPLASVLTKLGLIPVPDEILQAHKKQVRDAFFRANPMARRAVMRWYEFRQHVSALPDTQDAGRCPNPDPLSFISRMTGTALGTGPIPSAVTNIVEKTESRARAAGIETERVAGVFYTDPYVALVYREDGEIRRACLAIWDGPNVLHLAKLV